MTNDETCYGVTAGTGKGKGKGYGAFRRPCSTHGIQQAGY